MRLNRVLTAIALCGLVGVAGCNSASRALGIAKVTPDEFRVVSKAPLILPPDYSLRPPAPGEPRPQELQPESAARTAILGIRASEQRSEGEKLLASKAGGDKADPLVRYVVDDEFGDLAHKDPSFADKVMFWRKAAPAPAAANSAKATGADTAVPIDPAVEAARLKSLTGGKPVLIQRDQTDNKLKLPGL
jgi:hypothetical protein